MNEEAARVQETQEAEEAEELRIPWEFGHEGINFYEEITRIERLFLARALLLAGNKKRAAKLLGMKRTTFLEKERRLERGHLKQIHRNHSGYARPRS